MYGTFSEWNEVKIIIVGDQVWVIAKQSQRECAQKLVPAQFNEEES